jgi:arsenate reductase
VEIWTTVACSKTRAALEGLQQAGQPYQARSCLDEPPTPAEVRDLLGRLGAEPWEIARDAESREAGFGDLPRDAGHRGEWVAALCAHPRAIQRPIILLDDGTAVVARDPETLDRVLGT